MEQLEILAENGLKGIVELYGGMLHKLDGIHEPDLEDLNSPELSALVADVLANLNNTGAA